MSTKAIAGLIEAFIERAEELGVTKAEQEEYSAAKAELEALREACRDVVAENALEDWNTAQPSKLAAGIRVIQAIAKES